MRRVLMVAMKEIKNYIRELDEQDGDNIDYQSLMEAADQLSVLEKAFEKGGDADVNVEFFFHPR
tara:strand:- start:270 stop:461 length:192 start_codon:yes stop_codon:yes gene_type:complete